MSGELIVFFILALTAIASAAGMLLSRHAVYAALYLVLNFVTVAIFYLLLGSPFIELSQVTVYGGAIMVLFLFVIMLLGAEQIPAEIKWQNFAPAAVLGLALAGVRLSSLEPTSGQLWVIDPTRVRIRDRTDP